MGKKSLIDVFHRVNRLLDEDQKLITFPPNKPVHEAISFMLEHNISQVPLLHNDVVIGVFSYRSFSKAPYP